MARRQKVEKLLSKVMVESLEGTASFLDSFIFPISKLDKPRKQLFRVSKSLANDYRKLTGAKPRPITRVKKVERGIIYIEELQPINTRKKMDAMVAKMREVLRRKG